MLQDNSEDLRNKYYESIAQGDIEGALALRYQIILNGNANLGDYYSVGEKYFELSEFESAVEMLTQCINMGIAERNFWYQDSAYILRAYSFIKLRKINEAIADITKIGKDKSITWISGYGEINKEALLEIINKL
ncbi:TPA: hypothetical protein P2B70_004658 [Salmonella enterica subsp. enterica serovar Eastbourne]|nr:hypothetical protein [Salmonella enterica subsp. enterica serovar Eastbourne]HDN7576913.1 hypothetical protein [Salmonella enterica subsp. enterica serovar Eastbourne]